MHPIDVIIIVLATGWIASGLGLFGWYISKEGLPDYETYDGPKIHKEQTFWLLVAMITGGPIWWIIFYAVRYR